MTRILLTNLHHTLTDRLEDQPLWHRIRGHTVTDGYITGGPHTLTTYRHYCQDCEMVW